MLWISRMNALFLRNFVRLVYRAEISDSRGLRNAKCHSLIPQHYYKIFFLST